MVEGCICYNTVSPPHTPPKASSWYYTMLAGSGRGFACYNSFFPKLFKESFRTAFEALFGHRMVFRVCCMVQHFTNQTSSAQPQNFIVIITATGKNRIRCILCFCSLRDGGWILLLAAPPTPPPHNAHLFLFFKICL